VDVEIFGRSAIPGSNQVMSPATFIDQNIPRIFLAQLGSDPHQPTFKRSFNADVQDLAFLQLVKTKSRPRMGGFNWKQNTICQNQKSLLSEQACLITAV